MFNHTPRSYAEDRKINEGQNDIRRIVYHSILYSSYSGTDPEISDRRVLEQKREILLL